MNGLSDFGGKTILVTGGSSGIGNGIAQAFRTAGATVHVWGRGATAADYGPESGSDLQGLHYHCVNVADFEAVATWHAPFDALDVLVQSQGIVRLGGAEYDPAQFRDVLDVNLTSIVAVARRFRTMLAATQGSMVLLNSVGGLRSNRGMPAYDASKAGMESLTRLFAMEWGGKGVRVNGVAPGMVPTRLTSFAAEDPDRLAGYLAKVPLGRVGTIADVANAVLFLASDKAAYITGVTLPIDGGRLLT